MQINQTLCLPKTCKTYQFGGNDTCASIALEKSIALPILIGYNPAINSQCSNPDLNGFVICVSLPFSIYTLTIISGVAATQTGTYATSTIALPGAQAYKSTTQCGSWYQVHPGDYCSVISVSNGIALNLFMLIDPSIDSASDNLTPGLYYCVQPTMDWNITLPTGTAGPPVTRSAPAPTQSQTTSGCFQWYVVAVNDTCALIEESYGLTPQQFIAWNPSLNALCTNFILGDAYCVYGPTLSVSPTITTGVSSTTSEFTTTTTTSHSSTTSSSSCTKTYTVVSGDSCSLVATKFAITTTQLQEWNPSLDAACDLSIGQVLCVAGATVAPPCPKIYTVVSGDSCYAIYTKFTITDAQLMGWNPALDAACDLSVGQGLCVAD
ncbi:hypothetical protein MMC15_003861 [Xylographa vitiligo]|nr:hypothetical protein [Xylographa vitiligo]